jgi:hypothetical protein
MRSHIHLMEVRCAEQMFPETKTKTLCTRRFLYDVCTMHDQTAWYCVVSLTASVERWRCGVVCESYEKYRTCSRVETKMVSGLWKMEIWCSLNDLVHSRIICIASRENYTGCASVNNNNWIGKN